MTAADAPVVTAGAGSIGRPVAGVLIAAVSGFAYALVWTVSFPGVPMIGLGLTGLAFLLAAGLWLVLGWRVSPRERLAAGIVSAALVVVSVVLVVTGVPLRARFDASAAGLEAAVAAAEQHRTAAGARKDDWGGVFPTRCPSQAGLYAIAECHRFGLGYIFIETWNPVTDTSAFVYLPGGPRANGVTGALVHDFRHLSGPWYSWTCNC
jgi:hypothetical protein